MLQHAKINTFIKHFLPRRVTADTGAIVSVIVVESCSTVAPGSTSKSTLLNMNSRSADINVSKSPIQQNALAQPTRSQSITPQFQPCLATSAPWAAKACAYRSSAVHWRCFKQRGSWVCRCRCCFGCSGFLNLAFEIGRRWDETDGEEFA